VGQTGHLPKPSDGRLQKTPDSFQPEVLLQCFETVAGISRDILCSPAKAARIIAAKEALIVTGRRLGANMATLTDILNLSSSNVSRRYDSGLTRLSHDVGFRSMIDKVLDQYNGRVKIVESRESQA
jgi:hypothetical protein